jgi:hypothetical protein
MLNVRSPTDSTPRLGGGSAGGRVTRSAKRACRTSLGAAGGPLRLQFLLPRRWPALALTAPSSQAIPPENKHQIAQGAKLPPKVAKGVILAALYLRFASFNLFH